MGMPLRQLCLALLLAWVAFAAVVGYRHWSEHPGRAPDDGDSLETVSNPPDMAANLMMVNWRTTARERIVGALIRDEITMPEAAAYFRRLDRFRIEKRPSSFCYYKGDSDEERVCRQVIQYAALQFPEGPQRDELVARLEYELAEELYGGGVRLPDTTPGRRFAASGP
jgi:hypothetical protein